MTKQVFRYMLRTSLLFFILMLPLGSLAFAYGGDGDQSQNSAGESSPDNYGQMNIEPQFRPPDFVYPEEDKENTLENTWGNHVKHKPKHWSDSQWRQYKSKRQGILEHKAEKAHTAHNKARLKHQAAKGVGLAAAAAGAVVGAVATPAVAPTILIISVAGDGAAATAGSLAEGKSFLESAGDGVKKAIVSTLLSKVGSGNTNAAAGFAGGQAYDNIGPTSKGPTNQMPPPDTYAIGLQPGWK